MEDLTGYWNFLRSKGRPLSAVYEGNDDFALEVEDALSVVELLTKNDIAIVGGDILSERDNHLIYAYQYWGEEYICLNWYCQREPNESRAVFLQRSCNWAKESIERAGNVALKLGKPCFVVLVMG